MGRRWRLFRRVAVILCVILVMRKAWRAWSALAFVAECRGSLSTATILASPHLATLRGVQAPIIVIQNRHALQLTLNWLCNTGVMPGLHRHVVVVAMDRVSFKVLDGRFPDVTIVPWFLECLGDHHFVFGDGRYQSFMMFRANLAAALASLNISFWIVQTDVFVTRSPLDLRLPPGDVVFDRAGPSGYQAELMAAGNFYVRASEASRRFFEALGARLAWMYAPDNAMMVELCHDRHEGLRCALIDFAEVGGWQWFWQSAGAVTKVPALLQFDTLQGTTGKMAAMRELGLYFLRGSLFHCDVGAVNRALNISKETLLSKPVAWGERQARFYIAAGNILTKIPLLGHFFKYHFPVYAYFTMITL